MSTLKIGDEVKRISGKNKGMMIGDTSFVLEVFETTVSLEDFEGFHLKSALQVINEDKENTSHKPTMIKKLSNFYKKFTDVKTQALVKAGYLNGDLEPTPKAYDKLEEISFFANYEALVVAAQEEITEAEAEEAKKNS